MNENDIRIILFKFQTNLIYYDANQESIKEWVQLKDIEKLYPTLVAKSLRINHSRYIQKLYNPEEFTIKQLIAFSNLLDLDIQMVLDVIIRQLNPLLKSAKRRSNHHYRLFHLGQNVLKV